MATPSQMKDLSVVALIASDAAYTPKELFDQERTTSGFALLHSFPDSSNPADEQGVPTDLFKGLPNSTQDLTHHELIFRTGSRGGGIAQTVTFDNWVLIRKFENASDGFGAAVFARRRQPEGSKPQFIVAFQGSDGLDPQDWLANSDLAESLWAARGPEVINFLVNGGTGDDGIAYTGEFAPSNGIICFTGQSLGGGLAQYAAYFYAKALGPLVEATEISTRISLIDFNGFGAIAGIDRVEKSGFGSSAKSFFKFEVAENVPTIHYAIANDIVHRLGTGDPNLIARFDGSWHLNGNGNSYVLDFRRFKGNAPDVGRNKLSIVDAHRIESGFYRGFSNYAADFSTAPYLSANTYSYIDTRLSQNVAGFLSHVFSDGKTDTLSATARLSLGLVASSASGPVSELEAIKRAVIDALYESGAIDSPGRAALSIGTSAVVVKTVVNRALGAVNPVLGVLGWLFSFGLEFFKGMSSSDKQAATQEVNKLLPDDRKIVYQAVGDPEVSSADRAMQYKLYSVHSLKYIDPQDRQALLKTDDMRRLYANLASLDMGPDEFGARLVSDPHYVRGTLTYFAQAIDHASSLDDKEKQFTIGMLESEMSRFARLVGAGDPEFTNRMRADLGDFQRDFAYALSNANPDAATTKSTPITLTASTSFAETRSAADAFLEALGKYGEAALTMLSGSSEANAAEVEQTVRDIRDSVQSGAQTIVIRQGRSSNPFPSPDFDPDSSASLGALSEGSARIFTLYLPYDAGAGGQRVKLTLAGDAADKLAVLDHADEVALGADGAFTLVVPEGRKELSFSLWAKDDVDAAAMLELSAQLVDADDEATHFGHLELNLALDGVDETLPVAAREIRGDWAPLPYVDPVTGATYYKADDLGNIERQPGVPSTGDVEIDQWLDGSAGNDHIVTGDFDEQARGAGGDDFLFGSDASGNVLLGGAGADRIEGGGWADHAAEYWEWDYLGRPMGLGDDKIYGGAGDDQIWGEREATQAALNDADSAPTGITGDWLTGGSGADRIYGSAGDDVLLGGVGEDLLVGGPGMDVLLGDDDFQIRPAGNYWRVVHPNFGDSTPGFGGFELGLFPVINATLAYPDYLDPLSGDPYFTYYKDGGSDDVLIGGAGNDILIGQAGNDTLYGGADDDILAGWEGDDELLGGAGNDLMAGDFGRYEQPNQRTVPGTLLVTAGVIGTSAAYGSAVEQSGNDLLDGGAGNDVLYGEGGDDSLIGGDGDDTLYGDAPYLPEELHGNDILDGGEGDDFLDAGAGDDTLYGGAGDDQLFGGPGNDLLEGGSGDDALDGGDGDDVLYGEAGNDALAGGAGDDLLYGGAGADRIDGGGGDDLLDGGAGADVLRGGAGNDSYLLGFGYGRDTIEDREGTNRIRFASGTLPEDLAAALDSGTLMATLTYTPIGDAVSIDMDGFELGGIDFADGESWSTKQFVALLPALETRGSNGDDTLEGRANLRNALRGGGGDDSLTGAGWDDLLEGGDGADRADGRGGSDAYYYAGTEYGVDRIEDSGTDATERDVVRFGPGVALGDLALRVSVPAASAEAHPELPWYDGGTLSARWGAGGFDLALPGADRPGEGIEAFEFDDGSAHTLEEVLAQASVLPLAGEYHIGRDTGLHLIAPTYQAIVLDDFIRAYEVQISREGTDLLLSVGEGSTQGRVAGWYGADGMTPPTALRFAFDGELEAAALSAAGLELHGTEGDDLLLGLDGYRDALYGEGGDDVLDGGSGDDRLQGGDGADAYVLRPGGDHDTVENPNFWAWPSSADRIRAADGLEPQDVLISHGYSDVSAWVRGSATRIEVPDWLLGDARRLAGIEFADGTFWSADEMEARFEPAPGTPGDDAIFGSDGDDLIDALAGDDYVETGAGNDIVRGGPGADDLEAWGEGNNLLDAGPGDDYLYEEGATLAIGGAGDDWIDHYGDGGVIAFNPGDGNDTVYAAGAMTLSIGGGVQPDDLSLAQDGADLLLDVAGAGSIRLTRQWEADPSAWPEITLQLFGSVHLYDFTAAIGVPGPLGDALEANRISDSDTDGIGGAIAWQYATTGSTGALSTDQLRSVLADPAFGAEPQPIVLAQPNRPPRLAAPIPDQAALEDEPFIFTLPAGSFVDPDLGDALAFGAEVPQWLQFDPASATFFGTPGNDEVGTVRISVTATDGAGESAAGTFALDVVNVNDPPYLVAPLADQSGQEGAALSFSVAGAFADVDAGDALAYAATLADGGALPGWLAFDPANQSFSAAPGYADGGSYLLRVVATDLAGASAAGDFTLDILEAEPPPATGGGEHHGHPHDRDHDRDEHDDRHEHERQDAHERRGHGQLFDSLRERLARPPQFDFSLLARELERRKPQEVLSPEEIRRSWERVARAVEKLGSGDEDLAHGAAGAGDLLRLAPGGGHGFGYDASIGAARGQEGFTPFEGLREGFRRL